MTSKNSPTVFSALTFQFVFAAALACFFTAHAATNEISTEPGVLRDTLTNGLQVIIVRNTLAPVVTTMVNYRVGSDEAPAGFPGMAHATEHMMFRGSPGLSADQLAAISAAFGGDDDADTQQAVTQYFFTTPAENLEVALRVEATRMKDLLPDESLWTKERGAIEQEVAQDLSNPEYVFYEQLLAAVFKGTPYEHSPLGTRPSFDKTTDADLRKFHNTWYAPNNAVLVIVGNVEPQTVLAQVKKVFDAIPPKELPARPEYNFGTVTPDTHAARHRSALRHDRDHVSFSRRGNPDFAAAQILSDVLSSQRGKLYGLVPAGKALFADFEYETLQKSGLGYAIAGFPAGGNSTNLLSDVKEILLAEITNGVSADLVEAAKRREIISAELQKNSIDGLANAWSTAVAIEGRNSPDDDINLFRAVTVDDVNRVAKKYLDFDHAITAILTPHAVGQTNFWKKFWRRRIARFVEKCGCETAFVGKENHRRLARSGHDIESVRHESAQWNQADCAARNHQRHREHLWPRKKQSAGADARRAGRRGRRARAIIFLRHEIARPSGFPKGARRHRRERERRARIFRCKCCRKILSAARNCSQKTNFSPRCPKTISRSSRRNSPRAPPANCKAPTTSPGTH